MPDAPSPTAPENAIFDEDSSPLFIRPVMEMPWLEKGDHWPWPMLDEEPFIHLPLEPGCLKSMGAFMASLCLEKAASARDCMNIIREQELLYLRGGLEISCGQVILSPECCTSLTNWREWTHFLEGAHGSPWMGHDPMAWAELSGDQVILWTDGYPQNRIGPSITVPKKIFQAGLSVAEAELKAFLNVLPAWFEAVGEQDATDVLDKIRHAFL